MERVQKIIANTGLGSRREAERWIREGLVTINGKKAALGDQAELSDAIKVRGKLLGKREELVYFALYKPRGVIAMVSDDPKGRSTLKKYLSPLKMRVFPVGRMDYNGEGLILLTNDGKTASQINKSHSIERTYLVKVDRVPNEIEMKKLKRGTRVDGRIVKPEFIRIKKRFKKNALLEFRFKGMGTLELKVLLERVGLKVEKVSRTQIGSIRLSGIPQGKLKKLSAGHVKRLISNI